MAEKPITQEQFDELKKDLQKNTENFEDLKNELSEFSHLGNMLKQFLDYCYEDTSDSGVTLRGVKGQAEVTQSSAPERSSDQSSCNTDSGGPSTVKPTPISVTACTTTNNTLANVTAAQLSNTVSLGTSLSASITQTNTPTSNTYTPNTAPTSITAYTPTTTSPTSAASTTTNASTPSIAAMTTTTSTHTTASTSTTTSTAATPNTVSTSTTVYTSTTAATPTTVSTSTTVSTPTTVSTSTTAPTPTTAATSDRLAKYDNSEKTSDNVDSGLATLVSKALTVLMKDTDYEDMIKKYNRPDNIPYLVAPRLNELIYKMVPEEQQAIDRSIQGVQKEIVWGLCPLVSGINMLKKKGGNEDICNVLEDGLEMMARVSMNMNTHRRAALKPFMKDAKHLTKTDVPITTFLFGDELEKEAKKIDSSRKISESMLGKSSDNKKNERVYDSWRSDTQQAGTSREGHSSQGEYGVKRGTINRRFLKRQFQSFLENGAGNSSNSTTFPAQQINRQQMGYGTHRGMKKMRGNFRGRGHQNRY